MSLTAGMATKNGQKGDGGVTGCKGWLEKKVSKERVVRLTVRAG